MVDRVRKPAKHADTLSYLKDDVGVFASFKDAMVFAAALGFQKKSVAFDKSSEPIPLSVFRGVRRRFYERAGPVRASGFQLLGA